jgi:hypothetical protein
MFCQGWCYQGKSQHEVEILDTDGNVLCVLDRLELAHDDENEVVKIICHHKPKQ